jgi:hypothetical protein
LEQIRKQELELQQANEELRKKLSKLKEKEKNTPSSEIN